MKFTLPLLFSLLVFAQDPIPHHPTDDSAIPVAITGVATPLKGKDCFYAPNNPKVKGYLAVPEGNKVGAVILIHEWNGLQDRVRRVADALAAEGYVALCADLFDGKTGSNREENIALVRAARANPQAIIDNLDQAAAFLRAHSKVNGKIATIGWCFGGGVALSYAIGGKDHDGTAMFYGSLLEDPADMKHIHHEVYGSFAGLDRRITPEKVNEFVSALRTAGIPNDIHIYDNVKHGFWLYTERDPENNSEPALNAWQRLKAYLKRTIAK